MPRRTRTAKCGDASPLGPSDIGRRAYALGVLGEKRLGRPRYDAAQRRKDGSANHVSLGLAGIHASSELGRWSRIRDVVGLTGYRSCRSRVQRYHKLN